MKRGMRCTNGTHGAVVSTVRGYKLEVKGAWVQTQCKHRLCLMLCFMITQPQMEMSTCGLVAMTSASHAEGRQFDPGQVYLHRLVLR